MNIQEKEITFADEELIINNQRVLFWKRKKMLVLSDLHLGKPAHFRKNGIAIPGLVSLRDLQQLESLILYYHPEQILIVGDLVHADANKEVDLFKMLTLKFPSTKFILVKGNHDRFSIDHLKEIGISEVYHTFQVDSICFSHHSRTDTKGCCVVGHIHPGISIKMPTKGFVRLPCFVMTESEIILPAFSRFTGLDTKNIPKKATYFAFYENGIFEIEHFAGWNVTGS